MKHVAADLLHDRMINAFDDNPRGELYRSLSQEKLVSMLEQNLAEVKLALAHDNDVEDKLADAGNYVAFILRNYIDPPATKKSDMSEGIVTRLQGLVLDAAEGQRIIEAVLIRVRDSDQQRAMRRRMGIPLPGEPGAPVGTKQDAAEQVHKLIARFNLRLVDISTFGQEPGTALKVSYDR